MSDNSFYIPFAVFPGIGPNKFAALIAKFGSEKSAFEKSKKELAPIIGEITSEKFEKFRNKFDLGKYEKELIQKKISYVTLSDKNYPRFLKEIPNPPIILFTKGDKNLLNSNLNFAIVGTRKMTSYGKEVTEKFASELTVAGLTIVSGLALGVDAEAHKACLGSNGKTIAVLGNGVDLPFPASNKFLYDQITEKGLIISELAPGEPPAKGTFPSRNRIIAGISRGVLVTQGAADSGSMITADFALKYGRKLFAIPGPITSALSKGPNSLIAKGGKIVFDSAEILKELEVRQNKFKQIKFANLTKEENKIVKLLENEGLSFDQIVRTLKFDASKTASILSMMEISGIIKNSGGEYSLR